MRTTMRHHSPRTARTTLLAAATALVLSAAAPALAGQAHLAGLGDDGNRQFIVKFRLGSAPSREVAAMRAALDAAATRAGAPKLTALRAMALPGMRVVATPAPLKRAAAAALMRQLAADPNVEFVQADGGVTTRMVPNDPQFPQQWHYADSAAGVRAPTAWNATNGAGVVVAVVDSGIMPHNDLNANVLAGYDFVSSVSGRNAAECGIDDLPAGCGKSLDGDGRDANPADSEGNTHGNHVTGTIAAVTNNARGVAGIAHGARIVPVRAAGSSGYNAHSDTIDAIVWASGGRVAGVPDNANPAEVINVSLGSEIACTPAWQAGVDAAVANGAVVVVAAGNGNNNVSGNVPAGCNNVVSVGATDRNAARASYSAWGPTLDLSAPGSSVLSTVANDGYGSKSGTSMASPHVAGVAALVRSAAPAKTPAQVEAILKSTARPMPASKCSKGCGAGIVDAAAAVAVAKASK
ncbi:S8 family serine peptidase [Lysobacter enzymogenes]|uniref:Minor extracellular protease n=1 Tax=Lysobacter enzymogenes TaxID=69 RepID=A0AAU9ARA7_LYSEN|nr:S8 family serine peptidase [Lysobacter enzymogenes]BAV96791.1 minor extracellular protease [Lysobacter enzymogenes]